MFRHHLAEHLAAAHLILRIWVTSGWVEDLAWGLRVGTLVGFAAGLAGIGLGWW